MIMLKWDLWCVVVLTSSFRNIVVVSLRRHSSCSFLALYKPISTKVASFEAELMYWIVGQSFAVAKYSAWKTKSQKTNWDTWVPMGPHDQGPGGPCQVDPTCQKPHRPASGPRDLIHNPGDLGRPDPDSGRPIGLVMQASPLDRGGGASSRSEDRGSPSVITEGDLPNL
jgi:hypothetical protein